MVSLITIGQNVEIISEWIFNGYEILVSDLLHAKGLLCLNEILYDLLLSLNQEVKYEDYLAWTLTCFIIRGDISVNHKQTNRYMPPNRGHLVSLRLASKFEFVSSVVKINPSLLFHPKHNAFFSLQCWPTNTDYVAIL